MCNENRKELILRDEDHLASIVREYKKVTTSWIEGTELSFIAEFYALLKNKEESIIELNPDIFRYFNRQEAKRIQEAQDKVTDISE